MSSAAGKALSLQVLLQYTQLNLSTLAAAVSGIHAACSMLYVCAVHSKLLKVMKHQTIFLRRFGCILFRYTRSLAFRPLVLPFGMATYCFLLVSSLTS